MRGTLTAVAQLRARHRLAARCRGPAYSSAVEGPDGNDIPPTGESFKIDFCTVAHWVDGKIVEENLFYDLWVWCNSSDSAKTTCSGHADRLPVPTSGGVAYLVTSSPDLFGCCPENATSRMSRVPWNFSSGPMIIRLRSRSHHDVRHRHSSRRHAAGARLAALAGAGGLVSANRDHRLDAVRAA